MRERRQKKAAEELCADAAGSANMVVTSLSGDDAVKEVYATLFAGQEVRTMVGACPTC